MDTYQDIEVSNYIRGDFDSIFEHYSGDIDWRLLKSIAYNFSNLEPYVDGGLFNIPSRLYFEYDGKDPLDPSDNTATMVRIIRDWWDRLYMVEDKDKIYYIILAFKIKSYNIEAITEISTNFKELFGYFSAGMMFEIMRIVDIMVIM